MDNTVLFNKCFYIFEDPITKKRCEGIARIVEIERSDNQNTILAIVEFFPDFGMGDFYLRTLDINDMAGDHIDDNLVLTNEEEYWLYIENDTKYHLEGVNAAREFISIFDKEKVLITTDPNDDYYDPMVDDPYYSLYVGSVFSIFPSGKYYTPWANSNITLLEAAQDYSFQEGLESELDKHGYWSFSGEGDPCDIFIGKGL
jgi:hypothetical protein